MPQNPTFTAPSILFFSCPLCFSLSIFSLLFLTLLSRSFAPIYRSTGTCLLPELETRSVLSLPPCAHIKAPFHIKDKGQGGQVTVDNHLRAKQFCHKNKNRLRLPHTTATHVDTKGKTLSSLRTLLTSDEFRRLQRSYHSTQQPKSALHIKHRSRHIQSYSSPPLTEANATPVVPTLPLAAAKRLAKLCLGTQPISKHKALLFPSVHAASALKLGPCAPLVSKHLKRARADSQSSSDPNSLLGLRKYNTQDTMARHLQSTYESVQGGVSRLTEELASSLYLDKPVANVKSKYITSPSCASTYSDHSLFSELSHTSNLTSQSSRPTSDSGHCAVRTAVAHPSAHRILSLHHHSPEAIPKKYSVRPSTATQNRMMQCTTGACPPLDDPRSRYFARRNAIAPMADVDSQQKKGMSSFGPMRTSKSLKTARMALGAPRVSSNRSESKQRLTDVVYVFLVLVNSLPYQWLLGLSLRLLYQRITK